MPHRRPELEPLEDRVAPATNITIVVGAAGTGGLDHLLSATQGTITTADDPGDTAATLSTGALTGVNSTTNISIAADATISFNDLGGTLSLQTGSGNSTSFSTATGAISFSKVANTLATAGGSIAFNAGTSLTVANLNTGGGNGPITLAGTDLQVDGTVNSGTAPTTLTTSLAGEQIDLGTSSATHLGLTDTELSQVTAGVLRIGSSSFTGNITVAGSINTHSGYNTLDLIATGSGGAIVENTGSIAVANLALQADAGIGSALPMDVIGRINVAFLNKTSNNVQISSIGAQTIAAVDGVNTSQNNAAGGTVTLAALSPVTFAVNTTSSGTITATTTETAGETTTPLAPPDDDVTVNSGVTVESTGGDVILTSGDSIDIQSGAVVKSDTGTVTTDFGAGDNDSDAALRNNGTISGNLSIISAGDIFLDSLFPGGLNAPGATVSITSTSGGIFDSSNDHGDETDVTAANLALQASTGIGTSTDNIITAVSNLVAQTSTGGIFLNNAGDLTDGFSGDPFQGVTVTGTSGDIVLTDAGSVTVTTTGENIQGPANVTVTANGATANIQTGGSQDAIQNLGSGTVTLTAGQDIVLGTPASHGNVNADPSGKNGETASVFLNAGRDITIQGTGDSSLDAFGPTGDVTATAGRNINLLSGNAIVFTNGGGTITLTAGAAFTEEAGFSNVSTTINSPGADITITANTMTIQSVINAGNAVVTLKQNPGKENINLGTNPSPGNLGLAQTDLDNITARILRIGDTTNPGNITVSAPITDTTTGWTTLSLLTGGSVSETGTGALSVTSLAVQAGTGPAAAAVLSVSAPATSIPGTAFNVTVTAQDTYGNTATGYTGTVHFTSSDALAVLPADYAFTSTDKGAHTFSVTLTTVGSQTVTATDTVTGSISGSAAVSVNTATGAFYYVSPTGSNSNPGTLAAPFQTISHALTFLHPGDTLYLRAGTYTETLTDAIPSGTSWSAPATIASYPGETAIIEPASGTNGITISTHSYIILQNLVLDGTHLSGGSVVKIDYSSSTSYASHVRVTGCEIRNDPSESGVLISMGSTSAAVDYNEILNCTIHDNGGTNVLAHGIYCETNNNTFAGNTIYNNGGYGIQVYSGSASGNFTTYCSRNLIYDNRIYGQRSWSGITIDNGDSNEIYNNLIYGNADGGIHLSYNCSNTDVWNNTIYNNSGTGIAGIEIESGVTNAVIQNNISYKNGAGDYSNSGTGTTQDHNLFGVDPVFVNAAAGDFRLQSTSPAINAGIVITAVTTDFSGVKRDGPNYEIGAFEYAVQAAGGIDLGTNASSVSNVAGGSQSGGFSLLDSLSLTVTTVDGVTGISTAGGILLESSVANTALTVSQPVTTNGGGDIVFMFDNMTLGAAVSAAGHRVTLEPFSSGQLIDVGTNAGLTGTLGLAQPDLGNVTAATLQVGDSTSGNISVSNGITLTNATTLDLETGGDVSEGASGTIAVPDLAVRAVNAVTMNNANDVSGNTLAANVTGAGQGFSFTNNGPLTIGTVDGLQGITTNGGAITVTATAGNLTVNNNVSAGAATITLEAGGSNNLFTNNAAISNSGANQIALIGDQMALGTSPTSSITAAGGGRVLLREFTGGLPINLGTEGDPAGSLNLTNAELNTVTTTGVLQIGIGGLDEVSITATISPANVGTLEIDTAGNIRNTGGLSAFVEAPNLILIAGKAIGGDTQISRNDVLTQDATFAQAINYDLEGGTLTLSQTGAGGNIQLHNIDGTMNTSALGGVEPIGTGNQLALIASGGGFASDPGNTAGDLVVDAALSVGANNDNLLLASTNGNNLTVSNTVTNTGTGTVTLVATGALNVNAAVTAIGSVNLTAEGNASGDGVFINSNVTASGSGSTITVDANRDVSITGTNTTLATTNATGGAITVTAAEDLPNFPTGGAGAVTMGASTNIDTSANNSAITVDAGTTASNGGDITLGLLNANTGAVNVKSFAGSIVDGNGAANNITGGALNLSAGGAAGINLDVIADTPATAGVTATASNAPIVLRSTSQLQVDSINAGAAGDVTLTVNNANTATSSITSLHPNDNVADVIGRTVTLTATGPSNGATGQIGFFTSSAQFFEVAATTINASTNNSRLWISAIGGAAVGSISAGTDFAILKTVNGDLTSTHTGSTPDITAGTVILLSPGATGSFGSATNPVLVQTGTLRASVTGTGSINVTNVAAGGDLAVPSAATANGAINLRVANGNLATTASTGTDISAPGNTVTLTVSGNVVSGTAVAATDVGAANLAISGTGSTSGVGTSANPLKTALSGSLAANVGSGGVFVTNTSPALTIGTASGVNGITATGGNVTISTSNDLTVSQPVSTTGVVTLTGGTGPGANITINAAITGSSATVLGGAGNDIFTVTTLSTTPLHIDGLAGLNTLHFDGTGQHAIGTIPGELTMNSTLGVLTYANIENVNLNSAASVDAFYGPDTADRGAALPGLTAAERFVQVLYLDTLGRAGSKAEIDGWAAAFGGSSSSNAALQAAIARTIEGSMEGRDHEVKSWYVLYLGRAATGGEEMAWVNMLMAGQTEESVLSQILGSTEFFDRAQTLGFSGTANSQYVQALYELLVRRAGNAAEVAGWVSALPATGRQGAAMTFLDSGEFRTDQFEGYYDALLHRPSGSVGLSGWVALGADVYSTRVDFEASGEFFTNG
jgi:hypothetical protein